MFASTHQASDDACQSESFGYAHAKIAREYALRLYELGAESPRDRLLTQGAKSLSTTELLSILIGTGNGHQGLSALDIAQVLCSELEKACSSLYQGLRSASSQSLTALSGIGNAKAAEILAAIELGRRIWLEAPQKGEMIDTPHLAVQAFSAELMHSPVEKFGVLHLDTKHRLIAMDIVSIGSQTETYADPKSIFKAALLRGAARIILGHNHPSGDPNPSPQDIQITQDLIAAGNLMNIPVLDHVVLANGLFVSIHQMQPSIFKDINL